MLVERRTCREEDKFQNFRKTHKKEESFVKHVLKKATSLLLSAATIATSFACMVTPQNVEAEQVSGNAPFINTWLVSGPFENPVADQIYGTEVQELKNLAKEAKITVSSTYPNNPIEYICDGTTNH